MKMIKKTIENSSTDWNSLYLLKSLVDSLKNMKSLVPLNKVLPYKNNNIDFLWNLWTTHRHHRNLREPLSHLNVFIIIIIHSWQTQIRNFSTA